VGFRRPDALRSADDIRSPSRRALVARATLGLAALLGMPGARAAEPSRSIAVIYPDLGEPFRSVFATIIEGIEDRVRGRVLSLAAGNSAGPADFADEIRRREIKVLVGLGRSGMRVATGLANEVGVVVGCVVSVQESEARGFPVHTLAPDPALLLARLRRLMPAVRRVHVIYDPRLNAWLIRLARDAARAEGLELLAHEAVDQAAALRLYAQVLGGAEPARDALWLAQDSTTVDDNAVLPLVLREGWNRGLAVFSSNVSHVKRGALFSLYPDNLELGRALGGSALRALGTARPPPGVQALRETRAAVNTRTAAHLGLDVQLRLPSFDLVFPAP
jgi:putative ABC transport system substrate-binding protein